MSEREHAFDFIGGVPTHYDRDDAAPYGTIGLPHTFHCTTAFYHKLDACFRELWHVSPHGIATAVVSAGAHVHKPGAHGQGRAFDIDAIFWPGKTLITRNFPSDKHYYIGVEAILRKHFGVVLNYYYDNKHRDHFHIDDGLPVGFSKARSHTLFMEAACYHLFGKRFDGDINGTYGYGTRSAVSEVCEELGVPLPLTDRANWRSFLDAVARRGMGVASGRLPSDHQCTR